MCLNCSRRFPSARVLTEGNLQMCRKWRDLILFVYIRRKRIENCRHGILRYRLLGPKPRKNSGSHIDASHSRQPLVKGERLVRYEVNAVMIHFKNISEWFWYNILCGLFYPPGTPRKRRNQNDQQELVYLLGRSPHKNCKNDLDDQTWRELE